MNRNCVGSGRYTLSRAERIRGGRLFKRILSHRCRAADEHLIVYAAANGSQAVRLGVIVGKRLGKAVVRNRFKRMLREAFRLSKYDLPAGFDYVLIPTAGPPRSLQQYRSSLVRLARDAAEKARRRHGGCGG